MAESRERDGWGGKYTEYFDDDGNKIGESREIDGWSGKRTEYRDTNYNKVGESREIDGWSGKRTEYRDANYSKIGESREVDGFSGKRTEYRDSNYNKTGESRTISSLLWGRVTRREGSGWFPGAQGKTKHGESGIDGGGFSGSGSSFGWVGSAVVIVAVLFGVGLLARGLGPVTSTNTRASNPVPQGTLAPAPQVTFAPAPPVTVGVPGSLTARGKDDARLPTPAEQSAKHQAGELPKDEPNVPTAMSGIWEGTVSQPGSPEYTVKLRITTDSGILVEYPALSCGGSLMRVEVKKDEMLLRERIQHNRQGRCISDGLVRLIVRLDGQLRYEWYYPRTNPPAGLGATAVLTQESGS